MKGAAAPTALRSALLTAAFLALLTPLPVPSSFSFPFLFDPSSPSLRRGEALRAAELRPVAVRRADRGPEQENRAAAWRALQRGEAARLAGLWTEAADLLRRALHAFRVAEDRRGELAALRRLGLVCREQGDLDCAERRARHAYSLALSLDAPREALAAAADLGQARRLAGDLAGAERAYRQLEDLAMRNGNRREQALALNNLGRLVAQRGRPGEGLQRLRVAARLWWLEGAVEELAVTRFNLGDVYWMLGETQRAERLYARAAAIAPAAGPPLSRIGRARLEVRWGEAQGWMEEDRAQGVEILRDTARAAGAAGLRRPAFVAREGEARRSRGVESWTAWQQARALGRGAAEAAALAATRGRLLLREGRPGPAAVDLQRAAERARRTGESPLEVGLRDRLARSLAAPRASPGTGPGATPFRRPGPALAQLVQALGLWEQLRAGIDLPALRGRWLADRRASFALAIGLSPGSGDRKAAAVLGLAEGGRSRDLLDQLAGAAKPEAGEGRGKDGADLDLLQPLDDSILRAHRQVAGEGRPGRWARERDERLWQWRNGLLALRGAPPPVLPYGVEILQRHLLDDGEALLVYWLAPERSVVVWMDRDRLEVHDLPPADKVEALAVALQRSLSRGPSLLGQGQLEAEAQALGEAVLGPVGHLLGPNPGLRLRIVADGALRQVPFAILPSPADPRRRLVQDHPVSLLPSASVGLVLRRRALRPAGGERRGILALVDGVYGPDDGRLPGRPGGAASPLPELDRLPGTAREGEELVRLAGPGGPAAAWGPVRVLSGFEARREVLLGPGAVGHSILHVATHALADPGNPALSGLVLSRFDPGGRRVEGFLPAYRLEAADLGADLVVLSACSSAGAEAGEGIPGLAESLLVAGADRTLVSLWDVDDEATAELMERFYRALLVDGLCPPEALARAQAELAEDPRWSAPFYWAGFVLVGDSR